MYEEIKKPRLLKDIPTIFIRSLPVIYYFDKYAQTSIPENVDQLFKTNIDFISSVMNTTAVELEIETFKKIGSSFGLLKQNKPGQKSNQSQLAAEMLAEKCSEYKKEIHTFVRKEKKSITELYASTVSKLNVLIIKVNDALFPIDKINSLLASFCYYNVDETYPDSGDLSDKMLRSDVVVFSSTYNPDIHNYVKSLNSYKKPGIILVPLSGKTEIDHMSLRHSNQLQKAGYQVIFKSFTPIRLFTSIDKEFMKYNLN